jgi:hypothetical protein
VLAVTKPVVSSAANAIESFIPTSIQWVSRQRSPDNSAPIWIPVRPLIIGPAADIGCQAIRFGSHSPAGSSALAMRNRTDAPRALVIAGGSAEPKCSLLNRFQMNGTVH